MRVRVVAVADTMGAGSVLLRCSRCRNLKPPEAFGMLRRNRGRGGRAYRCRPCESEYGREWRHRHGERVHAATRPWRCARCREYQRPGEARTTEPTKRGGSFYLCVRCATAARYVSTLLRWVHSVGAARLPADAEPWTWGDPATWGELYAVDTPKPRMPDGLRGLRALAVGLVASAIDVAGAHDDTHVHAKVCAKCEERDEARRWLSGEDQGGVTISACLAALAIDADHLGALGGPACETCVSLPAQEVEDRTRQSESVTADWREAIHDARERRRRIYIRERVRRHGGREVPIAEARRVFVTTPGGPMWLPSGVHPAHADTLHGQMILVPRRRRGRPRRALAS